MPAQVEWVVRAITPTLCKSVGLHRVRQSDSEAVTIASGGWSPFVIGAIAAARLPALGP